MNVVMSGRLPVPAHEGAGPGGVAADVAGPVGISCPWDHLPRVGTFDVVGDISVRSGAFDAVGDRNPVPGRADCLRRGRVHPAAWNVPVRKG